MVNDVPEGTGVSRGAGAVSGYRRVVFRKDLGFTANFARCPVLVSTISVKEDTPSREKVIHWINRMLWTENQVFLIYPHPGGPNCT